MSKKDAAKALMTEREEVDEQIEENLKVLEANKCTMENPLVDEEGFPIASIDVYSVRHARTNIIRLRNDRNNLTEKISEALAEAYEAEPADASKQEEKPAESQSAYGNVHRTSNTPFAKVTSVTADSPAALDGFQVGDQVIQYGPLHHGNFKDMQQLGEITKENEGKLIRVTVIRKLRPVRLELHPRTWTGKGLLGCAIVPESTTEII